MVVEQRHVKTHLYKACPRCHGDLVLDADVKHSRMIDGRVEYVCLQCGRRTSIEVTSIIITPAASRAALAR